MPRCRRCHRRIAAGEYGPVCEKKRQPEPALFDLAEYPALPAAPPEPEPEPPIRPLLMKFDMFAEPAIDRTKTIAEQHKRVLEILK